MHRLKMRPILLIAGLIGLVAIVFGLVNTTNNAQATTPVGAWKLIGTVTTVKKSGTTTEWVVNMPKSAKADSLLKGDHVIVINAVPAANSYPPKSWRVLANKNVGGVKEIRLTETILNECTKPAAPVGGPMALYAGPCVKPVVGGGAAARLSGISDIVVDNATAIDLYHCISRTDVDNAGAAKSAAVCFDNTGALGSGGTAEPKKSAVGEGTNPNPTIKDQCGLANAAANPGKYPGCFGPPPPPPYAVAPPSKGQGRYCAAPCLAAGIFPAQPADSLVSITCFPDVGTSLNIIASVYVPTADVQITGTGVQVGNVDIKTNQTNAACDALTPAPVAAFGAGPFLTIYPVNNPGCPGGVAGCVVSPNGWRNQPLSGGSVTDWDGDGCSDSDELWQDKPNSVTKCGDDPWNPNDVMDALNVSGSYDLTAIAARQNCNPAATGAPTTCEFPGDRIPGFYYTCNADIQQSGKSLTAKVQCYIDSTVVVVNPKAVPAAFTNNTVCGPPPAAPADYCGDGISGSPPPGCTVGTKIPTPPFGCLQLLAKIGAKHSELTGIVDNAQNAIKLEGCFESNVDNPPISKTATKVSFTGNIYVRAVINMHTGHGQVNLWTGLSNGLTNAQCLTGATTGPGGVIPLHIVRQAPGPKAKPPLSAQLLSGGGGGVTCNAIPVPGTRHFVIANKQYQMAYGGTVEITGAGAGWDGRWPLVRVGLKTGNTFDSVPKNNLNSGTKPNPACPAAPAAAGATYTLVRDTDSDNCPDKKELGDSEVVGGLRDPSNQYDYINPTKDKVNRVDDIISVVNNYHKDFYQDPPAPPLTINPAYNPNVDRTAIPGANPWNLGPPNGIIRVDDILAMVKSYHHDC